MHASYGARIRAQFSDVKFYTQGLPVRGAGQQATGGRAHSVGNRTGGVLSPDTEIGLVFDAGFEHYAFLIDPDAVVATLTALTGRRGRCAAAVHRRDRFPERRAALRSA